MMFRSWLLFPAVLVFGWVLVVSCATATPVAPTSATAAAGGATPAGQSLTSTPGGPSQKINIDELLPPAPGRELVLQYCVNCHNIAPIALAHKTPDEWVAHRQSHTGRLSITKDEWDKIYNYLTVNYPADRVVPKLPPELLKDWTTY
jgi:hypothetical protein